jgi:hypothetical protein
MKITKEKLKNLIKEELQRTLEVNDDDQADVDALFNRVPDQAVDKIDRPLEILNLLQQVFKKLGAEDIRRASPLLKPYLRKIVIQLDKWDEEVEQVEVEN